VKGGKGNVSLLVCDVDNCAEGALERSAVALAPFSGAVIPTFSATPEHPKHRIILLPSRSLTSEEFPLAWMKMASTLEGANILIDKGCKNTNRLFFSCVTRSAESWLGARLLNGVPVPVDEMLSAARADQQAEAAERSRRATERRPVSEEHRDRYVAAAVEKARGSIASASEGGRHEALLREAFSLARFGLGDRQIESELLEAFVAVAGEARRLEGRRAVRDAVAARGAR
jgi:hypothetical protein